MKALKAVGDRIAAKLVNLLGAEAAEQLAAEVLPTTGLARLETADHRALFGARLVERGGLLAVVGRSIQTQATLHGALAALDRATSVPRRPGGDPKG